MLQDFPDVSGVQDLKQAFQQLSSQSSQLKTRNPTVTRHHHYFVSNTNNALGIMNTITLKKAPKHKHNLNTNLSSTRTQCRKSLPNLQPILLNLYAAASFQKFQIFPPSQIITQ